LTSIDRGGQPLLQLEPAADRPRLELIEAAAEPLHEHRAIAQPGQRIAEDLDGQPLRHDHPLGGLAQ
jgi:hypothetical protein